MAAFFLPPSAAARIGLPVFGGLGIAALAALLLSGGSLLWVALALGAGFVLIPSLVVSDALTYWLCCFLLTLPFDVTKTFMNSDRLIALVQQLGGPWGPPALSVHVMDLALLPLFGVWLVRKIARQERLWFPRISYLPLAFLCFTTLTAAVAPSKYLAFLALIELWKYFAIYLFAADALDVRRLGKPILAILLLTLLMQGSLTLVRYRLQYFEPLFGETFGRIPAKVLGEAEGTRNVATDEAGSLQRGFGTFYHANPTAMHLELLLPFALALALSSRWRRWKLLYAFVFAVGAGGLYVTFSRAGLVAFGVSSAVCVLVAAARGVIPRRALVLLVGIGLFAGLCLLPLLAAYMGSRPEYSTAHVEHLRQGMAIALRHPLFGVGLNNSSAVRPFIVPQDLTYEDSQLPIHSGHLQVLAETGVIGFGLYVGFFLLVAIEAFRHLKAEDVYTRVFALGTLGAYTAMCVHVTTDYVGVDAFHAMLWLYAGLIVASRRWEQIRPRGAQGVRHRQAGFGAARRAPIIASTVPHW
ncbi:MAG: O-antigen ligase protein [Deltaproteobacteria bacterium]|nr:O-antigen ligase protein [Deltaproteobacteria bacterium]